MLILVILFCRSGHPYKLPFKYTPSLMTNQTLQYQSSKPFIHYTLISILLLTLLPPITANSSTQISLLTPTTNSTTTPPSKKQSISLYNQPKLCNFAYYINLLQQTQHLIKQYANQMQSITFQGIFLQQQNQIFTNWSHEQQREIRFTIQNKTKAVNVTLLNYNQVTQEKIKFRFVLKPFSFIKKNKNRCQSNEQTTQQEICQIISLNQWKCTNTKAIYSKFVDGNQLLQTKIKINYKMKLKKLPKISYNHLSVTIQISGFAINQPINITNTHKTHPMIKFSSTLNYLGQLSSLTFQTKVTKNIFRCFTILYIIIFYLNFSNVKKILNGFRDQSNSTLPFFLFFFFVSIIMSSSFYTSLLTIKYECFFSSLIEQNEQKRLWFLFFFIIYCAGLYSLDHYSTFIKYPSIIAQNNLLFWIIFVNIGILRLIIDNKIIFISNWLQIAIFTFILSLSKTIIQRTPTQSKQLIKNTHFLIGCIGSRAYLLFHAATSCDNLPVFRHINCSKNIRQMTFICIFLVSSFMVCMSFASPRGWRALKIMLGMIKISKQTQCCICLKQFLHSSLKQIHRIYAVNRQLNQQLNEKIIFKTICNHQFHYYCIKQWIFKSSATCPKCRQPINYRYIQ